MFEFLKAQHWQSSRLHSPTNFLFSISYLHDILCASKFPNFLNLLLQPLCGHFCALLFGVNGFVSFLFLARPVEIGVAGTVNEITRKFNVFYDLKANNKTYQTIVH